MRTNVKLDAAAHTLGSDVQERDATRMDRPAYA
jgi:hypothetical protein